MNGRDRAWLLGATIALAVALLATAWEWKRWTALRRGGSGGEVATLDRPAPSAEAIAAANARLDAIRHRLPAAGTAASRQAQQAVLDLVQRQGVEITDVAPKSAAEGAGRPLPGCPGWPAVIMELRGRATFPTVAAILAALPQLEAVVVPMEVELQRGASTPSRSATADPEAPAAPEDRRIQVRFVLAL